MLKKLTHILYGIRLIVTWVLTVLMVLEGYCLVREFSIQAATCNLILGEAEYRQYSNEYTMYKVSVDGKDMTARVPAGYTAGDEVEVIVRDDVYPLILSDEESEYDLISKEGRAKRALDNDASRLIRYAAALFIVTSALTLKKGRDIRQLYPKLTKATFIFGAILIIPAVVTIVRSCNFLAWDHLILNTLLTVGYPLVFTLIWITAVLTRKDVHSRSILPPPITQPSES